MEKLKRIYDIIKYNFWSLIGFEFLFKIMSFMIFTPLFLKSFTLIMKLTGYRYLTLENVISFMLNPITIFSLILLILIMTLYTMFDIASIIVILDGSYQKKKIKIIEAIHIALKKCCNIIHIKNIPLAFLVLFLIPFLNIGISSSFITTINIPEFISDFIVNNKMLLVISIIVSILLLIILLKWIYSLHYFILEEVDFKEARKRSNELSRKSHLKDFFTLFLIQLLISIFSLIFIVIGIFIIIFINKIFKNIILLKSITITIICLFIAISFVLFMALSTPISYASISVMYYFHKLDKKEKIKSLSFKSTKANPKVNNKLRYVIVCLGIIAIISGTIFTYGVYKGKYNLDIEYVRSIEITAHRGASVNYPENTMSAFIGAKELGADWIELDVQQTKDGFIIVSHDANLSRVTGVNKDVIDMTYDEIKELDAGTFYDKKFKDERIPLLSDVVKWAKENSMNLNIELKPTGKETNFEVAVIDIIKENQYQNNCVVTSQVYTVLENVKRYDERIETVYVMSLAVGDIVSLDKADHFSVEASNVNKALVSKVHNAGKQLYVWTVNTEENIRKIIDYNVDNIITDNISLARDTVMKSKTSNLINEYIKFIENIF